MEQSEYILSIYLNIITNYKYSSNKVFVTYINTTKTTFDLHQAFNQQGYA